MTRHRHLKGFLAALAVPVLVAACSSGGGTAPLPTIPLPRPGHPDARGHVGPDGHPTYPPGCPTEQPRALGAGETRTVTITTDKGDITIKIDGRPVARSRPATS